MSKGSAQRPGSYAKFGDGYDKAFNKKTVYYVIETKEDIFWSRRKMDVTFKHVQFLYRDRVKYKELTETKFNDMVNTTDKNVYSMEGDNVH